MVAIISSAGIVLASVVQGLNARRADRRADAARADERAAEAQRRRDEREADVAIRREQREADAAIQREQRTAERQARLEAAVAAFLRDAERCFDAVKRASEQSEEAVAAGLISDDDWTSLSSAVGDLAGLSSQELVDRARNLVDTLRQAATTTVPSLHNVEGYLDLFALTWRESQGS